MWMLTDERKNELLRQRDQKLHELDTLKKKTNKDLWREDLDEFSKKLDEVEEKERNELNGKGKDGKKGATLVSKYIIYLLLLLNICTEFVFGIFDERLKFYRFIICNFLITKYHYVFLRPLGYNIAIHLTPHYMLVEIYVIYIFICVTNPCNYRSVSCSQTHASFLSHSTFNKHDLSFVSFSEDIKEIFATALFCCACFFFINSCLVCWILN